MNTIGRRALLGAMGLPCIGLSGCTALIVGAMSNIGSEDIKGMTEVPAERQFAFRALYGKMVFRKDKEPDTCLPTPLNSASLSRGLTPRRRSFFISLKASICSEWVAISKVEACSTNADDNRGMTQETIIHAGQTKYYRCYVDAGTETFVQFMRVDK